MKRWKKLLVGVLSMALMLPCVPIYGLEVKASEGDLVFGDFEYTLDEDGNNVTITKYNGEEENAVIPSEIDGKKVTTIGYDAFSGCSGLASVTIPDGVTTIGDDAFSGCSGLASVTIPHSVTRIGSGAFSGCIGLASVTIPDSVTKIGEGPFGSCSGLTSIIVEEGNPQYNSRDNCNAIIKTDSNALVQGCRNTVIPSDVTSIGGDAFSDCSGLISVAIPDSVTEIGKRAFYNCNNLTGVMEIPEGVVRIQDKAFYNCSGLSGINFPASVAQISYQPTAGGFGGAFHGCTGLKSIKVDAGNKTYDSREGCNALIETESNTLILGCENTAIPEGVTTIAEYAFHDCKGLTSLHIPASLTTMKHVWGMPFIPAVGPFVGCTGLERITVDAKNPVYDSRGGCNALIETDTNTLILASKNTVIPESVTSIRTRAFYIDGISSITIPAGVESIDSGAFIIKPGFIIYGVSGTEAERYANKCKAKFIPVSEDISKASIILSQTSYAYDGTAKTPSVTVTLDEKTLTLNTDYIVAYSDNINVGTAKVTVAGKGNYTGSKTVEFTITKAAEEPKKADISKASVTLSQTSYTYDGTAKAPSVTVALDGKTLALNTDYTVAYSNNIKVGTAKATVAGKGNYTGSKSVNFTIVKAAEQPASKITCKKTLYKTAYGAKPFKIHAASKSKMIFTSSKPKIAAVGKNTGKVTIKNTGVATITIKAGTAAKKVTVKVSPKKPSVKSAKAAKGKKLTVKWAKDKMASGYQVQVSTDKKFKENVKSKSLPKTSYTFTKLKTGKKYYVRIRSYKKSGKETLYSAWSKAKVGGKIKK